VSDCNAAVPNTPLPSDAPPWVAGLMERLERIERHLALAVEKEWYTTEEAAERLGRKVWPVRQWCNKGQVPGAKKVRGKGRAGEWRIPHEGLVRLQNEGPLPPGTFDPRG
jgi:hypothetical protein